MYFVGSHWYTAFIKSFDFSVTNCELIKFIYSEKATKFCEISNLLLSVFTADKSKVEGDFAKFYGFL